MGIKDKDFFAKRIKAAGQGLIDNADYLVNNNLENVRNFSISIYFDESSVPSIDIITNFVPNKIIDCYKNNS